MLNEKFVNFVVKKEDSMFYCVFCSSFYVEFVMLDCGYMLCKSCILLDIVFIKVIDCKLCGCVINYDIVVNVLMIDLI